MYSANLILQFAVCVSGTANYLLPKSSDITIQLEYVAANLPYNHKILVDVRVFTPSSYC